MKLPQLFAFASPETAWPMVLAQPGCCSRC